MSQFARSSRKLVQELLSERNTEQDVAELVHEEFEDNVNVRWVPLGNEPNNYSTVENQQAKAMAALTELLTNSSDAVILKNYFQRFGDSYSGDEFDGMHHAAEELVDPDECEISLTAQGEQNGPFSLTVYDNGIGQPHERFETTFLKSFYTGRNQAGI